MEMSMKEDGRMTRLMVTASTYMLTVRLTRENGLKISSRGGARKHGLMVPAMKANTSMERNMGKGASTSQMEAYIKETLN
jgi:hypothetical protein